MIPEENVPLSRHTTIKMGGSARYFIQAKKEEDLHKALAFANERKIPFFILGKGSNTVFPDQGFAGLVIKNQVKQIEISDTHVCVSGGYSFSHLGIQTAKKSLSGLEFACGIPGSVGGAIFMNAGANGSETKDCLVSVRFLHEDGRVEEFSKSDLDFSYRTSSFQKMKGIVLSACFQLRRNANAKTEQMQMLEYRKKTQPYGEASAGCAFRNPPGHSAGQLIESCGLKGLRIGDAEVSALHANFFINRGNASEEEMRELLKEVQKRVSEKTGIVLEEEIRLLDES